MVRICKDSYTNTDYTEYFSDYKFDLSDFQKYAIEGIIKGEHVLVTAHTGSGKTLPAEFAIKHFSKKGKKLIYTSPIKALSNQKFYDFTQKFPNIEFGLFTGDIKTNPEADVLIMTTEILMNTLFNKNTDTNTNNLQFQIDFDTELAAVVFDEIHYINDPDRGQVWEKSLLMLPPHIQMIMLSATIDDPERFARWCEEKPESTKQVYLCSTNHRVVPLSHYNYLTVPESNLKMIKDKQQQQLVRKYCNQVHCLQNEKGVFNVKLHGDLIKVNEIIMSHKLTSKRKFVLNDLSKYLRNNNMLPAIGFLFSRKQVEQCARDMTTPLLEDDSKIPFLVKKECDQILRRLPNHEEYKRLPEYIELTGFLEKGIGIHHSGMIPILREIVELCITKKYIKLLFATESFAIGLDCPIKTAMFLSLTKFDGNHDRMLHSHEYTQMAGRAGRRGIDTIGYVIRCNNLFKPPSESAYKTIMCGKPPKLVSKYKISYCMVLNVLRANPDATLDTIVAFTNRSMMHEEVEKEIKSQEQVVNSLQTTSSASAFCANTPEEICKSYAELIEKEKVLGNKKKKECQRKIATIEQDYKSIKNDVETWKKYEEKQKTQEAEQTYLTHLQGYIATKTDKICSIMIEKRFLTPDYKLTQLGEIASHIAEVDATIWTLCMFENWNYMKDFTEKQIVGLFSCATDIKVNQEYRKGVPSTEDEFLKTRVKELGALYETYAQSETDLRIESGINYETPLSYDIMDESMAWCDCSSEEECKMFISEHLQKKEIAIGDFTKAMMKIATIAREMQSVGELDICKHETEWVHKMSKIEDMVLKYIATNQSLYV